LFEAKILGGEKTIEDNITKAKYQTSHQINEFCKYYNYNNPDVFIFLFNGDKHATKPHINELKMKF